MLTLLSTFPISLPFSLPGERGRGLMQITPSCIDLESHSQLFLFFSAVFSCLCSGLYSERTHAKQSVTVKVLIKHRINRGRETLVFM